MDADTRSAFDDLKQILFRMEEKADTHLQKFNDHLASDAALFAEMSASTKSAHKRMDTLEEDVKESEGAGWKAWSAIIIAGLTAVGAAVASFFTGKSH